MSEMAEFIPLMAVISAGVFLFWLGIGVTIGDTDWSWPAKLLLAGGFGLGWPLVVACFALLLAFCIVVVVLYAPAAVVLAFQGKQLVEVKKGKV